ncbi:MAG: endonuclease/exonuclease/phosphatase family protein [Gammaproteobacteria bacterium]|nr:endonuclease/exonuclease/phosphatase family protein [Gammaproteobacteria bacterium]
MSYNVQVGISTRFAHQYITNSWKHVLPHNQRLSNLDKVAQLMSGCDVVGLQEVDAGSMRSNYINLVEYLALKAGYPYWYHQVNRNLGRIAQHSNGLLSRFHPSRVEDLCLPALIPGRNAIVAHYGQDQHSLAIVIVHLSLSTRARLRQLEYISERITGLRHVILMGDLNCKPDSKEMNVLFRRTRLHEPIEATMTFPSWRPQHNIDHILVTPEFKIHKVMALDHAYSDHLPLLMEIALPEGMELTRAAAA